MEGTSETPNFAHPSHPQSHWTTEPSPSQWNSLWETPADTHKARVQPLQLCQARLAGGPTLHRLQALPRNKRGAGDPLLWALPRGRLGAGPGMTGRPPELDQAACAAPRGTRGRRGGTGRQSADMHARGAKGASESTQPDPKEPPAAGARRRNERFISAGSLPAREREAR